MKINFAERRIPPLAGNAERYFCIYQFRFGLILMLIVMGWVFEGAVNRVFSAPMDQEIETKYNQTREAFFALDKSPQKKQRQHWQPLIEGFKEIYKQHPQTPWGEKSMFMVGRVSYVLFQWSGMEPDLDLALDHFSRFVNHYPQSPLADDALFLSAEIYFLHRKDLEKARQTTLALIKEYPKGDMKKRAEELLMTMGKSSLLSEADKTDLFKEESIEKNKAPAGTERPKKPFPQVTGLRHWSTPLYTRIVVD
ncbi:MAG: tetratricopeptide repeat protein, partial [Deltaproteobacteria bacterium]|nr:tetratricopeptide repeat protein [Deltaproteobacteria bacterium]